MQNNHVTRVFLTVPRFSANDLFPGYNHELSLAFPAYYGNYVDNQAAMPISSSVRQTLIFY